MGELEVRGPWVASSYYDTPEQADRWTADGWFKTGDIVSIHPRGYIQIKDRSKDVIKSGGEWISSVELENALMAHPAVAEAAVIAIPDEKWDERPLAAVVLKPGAAATADELRELPRAELREVVAAGALRVRRRDPEDERRQVPQDGAARAVRAGAGADLRAALLREVDGPFELTDVPDPDAADGKVLVRVRAAGDQLRRRARPSRAVSADAGAPGVLGSEIAGELEDGTRVMAITSGAGGYAELAAVDRAQVVPLPDHAIVRRGRVVPAHVPDGAHPADAAGARAAGYDGARATRPPAASARRRSRSRARSARACSRRSARRRSSTSAARSAPRRRTSTTSFPDDLAVDVVVDPVGGELFARRSRGCEPLGDADRDRLRRGAVAGDRAGAPRRAKRRPRRASTSAGCCASRPSSSASAVGELLGLWQHRRVQAARRRGVPARRGRARARARRVARSVGKVVLLP